MTMNNQLIYPVRTTTNNQHTSVHQFKQLLNPQTVRIVTLDDMKWFSLNDVLSVLELDSSSSLVNQHCPDKQMVPVATESFLTIISEQSLYRLFLAVHTQDSPAENWLTSSFLPAIGNLLSQPQPSPSPSPIPQPNDSTIEQPSGIIIYTDGSCNGNGKAYATGGWAYVLTNGVHQHRKNGREEATTNNRMELQAAIQGLIAVEDKSQQVTLFTDSKYLQNGANEWMDDWKNRGWKTKAKKPVQNLDLWRNLDNELSLFTHRPIIKWVRGHNGNPLNELADKLAESACRGMLVDEMEVVG